jgi:ankyrin repeat protein
MFLLIYMLLGDSVNAINYTGYSALHLAAASGSKSLVKWLVEKGASPFQRNSQGYRPIDLADMAGNNKLNITFL